MNKKQIQKVILTVERFLKIMNCRPLSLEEYAGLAVDLATGKEFVHYRVFDHFTELSIMAGRESFAIVKVRNVREVNMTNWLNSQIGMQSSIATLAA